jgi:putative Holliday junction resolvase|tara:strand:- start:97 stop:510 length:414 start_codon:yes stop_codon:yes gene_type:complete
MGCIVALDVGTKTIGIAKARDGGGIPSPHSTLSRKGVKTDVVKLAHILSELQATVLVVGLPLELDDSEGRSARLARQIGDALAEATGLPLHYQDERYSTVVATERLQAAGYDGHKRKEIIDQAAAAVILEDFLARTL